MHEETHPIVSFSYLARLPWDSDNGNCFPFLSKEDSIVSLTSSQCKPSSFHYRCRKFSAVMTLRIAEASRLVCYRYREKAGSSSTSKALFGESFSIINFFPQGKYI